MTKEERFKKEKRTKDLIKKADKAIASNTETTKALTEKLRAKLVEIKESGLLPRKYAQIINERMNVPATNSKKVYLTFAGRQMDLDVAEAIIDLALEQKREQKLIDKANKALAK